MPPTTLNSEEPVFHSWYLVPKDYIYIVIQFSFFWELLFATIYLGGSR